MRFFEIENKYQKLRLIAHGATIYEWLAFSDKTSIMMNNDDLNVYKDSKAGYFGSTIGRVANRIKDAKFILDDITYQLPKNFLDKHNLHGGSFGFNLKVFDVVEHTKTKIKFKTVSPDLENGFPGEVTLYVTYELLDNQMLMHYEATTTKPTILNITNHGHFNLGDETILNHKLKINADRYLKVDQELIPTGDILSVKDTPLDFMEEIKLEDVINQLKDYPTKGIDHAFLFEDKGLIELSYKNKKLKIETSYPGTQVYSMNRKFIQKRVGGFDIPLYAGIAFECQFEPDAINHHNFNQTILRPNQKYDHFIKYTLTEE